MFGRLLAPLPGLAGVRERRRGSVEVPLGDEWSVILNKTRRHCRVTRSPHICPFHRLPSAHRRFIFAFHPSAAKFPGCTLPLQVSVGARARIFLSLLFRQPAPPPSLVPAATRPYKANSDRAKGKNKIERERTEAHFL